MTPTPETDADQLTRLSEVLACAPEHVPAELLRQQGIALLSDAEFQAGKGTALLLPGEPSGWRLQVGQRAVLLYEDPWSTAAVQILLRHAHLQARLGLARPGQVEQLRSAARAAPVVAAPSSGAASPVVSFVDAAIARAYADGASDIHFETDRQGVRVKYRLDGVMAPGEQLADPQRAEEVISRIKVMAQLDITERRRPQDGRVHWQPAATIRSSGVTPVKCGEPGVCSWAKAAL